MIVSGSETTWPLTSSDLAGERRDHLAHRLDGLHFAVALAPGERRPCLRRLEMDDLAERVLRVPGDPERGLVAVDSCPVVLGVVAKVVGVAFVGGH